VRNQWIVPSKNVLRRSSRELAICLPSPAFASDETHRAPEGASLSPEEIRRLIRLVQPSKLVLISDRIDHPTLDFIKDLSPHVFVCSGWNQLEVIRSFGKIAISQDVTQWWGAFLSDAEEIYFPKIDRGPWSHTTPADLAHEPWWQGIDLSVMDDSRYIYDW
jgi:hypothetical protein